MFYKYLIWHVLLIFVSCELYKDESRYLVGYAPTYHEYKPRDYEFGYAVSDPHTGDHKSQWEVKTNGVVRGGYSLLEPDGTTRIVEYIADDDGFRAVVKKLGVSVHPELGTSGIVPLEVAHYGTYDGQVGNYAQGKDLGQVLYQVPQHVQAGSIEVQSVPATHVQDNVPHFGDGIGEVSLQGSTIGEVVQQGAPIQGHEIVTQNLPHITQEIVPLHSGEIQGQQIIENVPQTVPQENLGYIQQVPQQSHEIGEQVVEIQQRVPLQNHGIVAQNLQPISPETLPLPVQSHQIAPQLTYHNLGYAQGVPYHGQQLLPSLTQERLEPGIQSVPSQEREHVGNLNIGEIQSQLVPNYEQTNLPQAIPTYHSQNLGGSFGVPYQGQPIEADLRVPIDANNLPQPQYEIQTTRKDTPFRAVVVPRHPVINVPISPSYTTNINYGGYGGENRLKKDVYHASYSQQEPQVVPIKPKKFKKHFRIYYPEERN